MKLLFALLLTFSFAYGMGAKRPAPVEPAPEAQNPGEIVVPAPGPVQDKGEVKVLLNVNGTPAQIARVTRLKGSVQKIINSPEFKSRVLGAWYKGKAQFVDTTKSNAEVFAVLTRSDWDLEVRFEKLGRNVLGRTFTNVKWFSFNTRNFDTREDSGIVGTICHEYSHKLGFSHSYKSTAERPYSVPYAVGTICAELYPLFK